MRWQQALTKQQLRHMRKWQPSLTLNSFMINREHQKNIEETEVRYNACPECAAIEARLREKGVLK